MAKIAAIGGRETYTALSMVYFSAYACGNDSDEMLILMAAIKMLN